MSNGITSIEQYPPLQIGKIALAPGPTGYLYIPVEPGGLVPAITPPPDTIEGYPVFTTMGVAIGNDGGVWQYQGSKGMTEVIPSLAPPTNVTPPSLTYVTGGGGAGNVGSIYSCNAGTWTPTAPMPVYTRQWLRDGDPIAGSTGTTYTIALADVGHIINCAVVATNPAGSSAPFPASNPVGPIPEPAADEPAPPVRQGGGSGSLPPRPKTSSRKKR